MIAFSPGIVQGCFDLLGIASRNVLTFPQIRSAFGQIGSLPSEKIIDTTQAMKWLRAEETGFAILTPSGARLQALKAYEPMLRQALLDYVDVERPAWVQNATFGRMKVIAFAGNQVGQVFVEAGLADGTSDDVVAFWDEMSARARGLKHDRLNEIGRQGERLTIAHEEKRTGRRPKWVSIDNNSDGYDVLSVLDMNDPRSLSIEVKSSTMGLSGTFHVTRNEWERAVETENHMFHLWALYSNREPALAAVSPQDIESHIPVDQGVGNWELVEIPFRSFQERFVAPI